MWVLVWMNVVTVNINGSLHHSGQSFSLRHSILAADHPRHRERQVVESWRVTVGGG